MIKAGIKREAVRKKSVSLGNGVNERYFKGPSTNADKYVAKGTFKNKGQKPGSEGKSRLEGSTEYVSKRLKRISRGMFHAKKGEPMRAQLNA